MDDEFDVDHVADLDRPPLRTPPALRARLDEVLVPVRRRPVLSVVAVVAVVGLVAVAWSMLDLRAPNGSTGAPLPKVTELDRLPGAEPSAVQDVVTTEVDPGADADRSPGSGAAATAANGADPAVRPPPPAPAEVFVHVAGAVQVPGLYELPPGARVADAVTAAGGFLADADGDRINLAAIVVDGDQVLVPRRGEPIRPPGTSAVQVPASGTAGRAGLDASAPVDVNTATAEQLESLPGIGPAIAAAIVRHREQAGPFTTVDDLADVPGIGPAKLDTIRDLVTV